MSDPRKVDSIKVFVENRRTDGSPGEPNNFSVDMKTDKLFNFGAGQSEQALIDRKTILATHVSYNNPNYSLSIAATSGNAKKGGPPGSIQGNGTPVPLDGGDKVDIVQWTVILNPRF